MIKKLFKFSYIKHNTSITIRNESSSSSSSVVLKQLKLLSNQTSIAFTHEGNQESDLVFVALHGGPGSHNDFKYLAETLKISMKESYQLIRFDLPGYGKSERLKSSIPNSKYFSSSVIETLSSINIINNKRIVVIGHSLGGHIAINMAKNCNISGIVLLSTVCCRPHKALGNDNGYKITKWLGLNVNHFLFGNFIQIFLEFMYKKILGFPRHSSKDEIVWTQQRVAYLDWIEFTSQVKSLTTPVLFAYTLDDKLLEPPIFKELANILTSNNKCSENKIIEYNDGGHNIQKTKAVDLSNQIKDWLQIIIK